MVDNKSGIEKREYVTLELKDDETEKTRSNFFKVKEHLGIKNKGEVIRRALKIVVDNIPAAKP
jgi:hypothetical protein